MRAAMVAAVLCASGAALAQGQPSLGFHIGDGVLHPFLEGDGTFDSQAVRQNNASLADIVFHVRPGLKFDLMNPSTQVSFLGSAEGLFYTGWLSKGVVLPFRVQANVAADAAFNKDGAVEFQIGDALTRSDRTRNPAADVGVLSLYNNVHVAVPIHPGGRALEITPSVGWGIEFFDCITVSSSCVNGTGAGQVGSANYSNLSLGLNGRWKFLPKTAVVVDVQSDIRTYWTPSTAVPPSTLLRAQAGLAGLISAYFNVTLLAGYVHDFVNTNLHNVIGQAEIGYQAGDAIRLSAGYLRTVLPVPGHSSPVDDRPYLRGTLGLWAGRLTLSASGMLDILNYYYETPSRTDYILSINAGATVAVLPWMDVGLLYGFSTRIGNLPYDRHEATLRLGVHY